MQRHRFFCLFRSSVPLPIGVHMFRTTLCVAIVSLFLAPNALSTPVQYSGNSHYYDVIAPVNGINWTDAKAAAAGMTFQGVQGHLATFANAAEMQFGLGLTHNYTWIGLTDEVTEGQFLWVTGEPF